MFRKAINTMFYKDSLLFLLLTGFRLQNVHLFINPRTRMSEQKRWSRSSQHHQAAFSTTWIHHSKCQVCVQRRICLAKKKMIIAQRNLGRNLLCLKCDVTLQFTCSRGKPCKSWSLWTEQWSPSLSQLQNEAFSKGSQILQSYRVSAGARTLQVLERIIPGTFANSFITLGNKKL